MTKSPLTVIDASLVHEPLFWAFAGSAGAKNMIPPPRSTKLNRATTAIRAQCAKLRCTLMFFRAVTANQRYNGKVTA